MTFDLFGHHLPQQQDDFGPDITLLRGFVLQKTEQLMTAIEQITSLSPLRYLQTPGGYTMSAAMTNCGDTGWISDHHGYRYNTIDPVTGQSWPPMPALWQQLAESAASQAGFTGFIPDACLINRYTPDAKMSLHQDKDERDITAPIVSVSLGMTATFLFGGTKRSDTTVKIPLLHGDVIVWGRSVRLNYHGIAPLKNTPHPLLGAQRFNLTFRKTR